MYDSDTDSDILESTVHGTQDACNKEAVIIKTEEFSDSDSEDSIVLAKLKSTIQYDLTKTPLVYTTRLDDMNVFKKNKSRSCNEAAEIILAESKPRYVQRKEQIYQTPLNNMLRISYIQLCSNVQQLNIQDRTAKIEAREMIAEKMKMCKPLKIVLTDIMEATIKPAESTSSSDSASSTCRDDDDDDLIVPVIYSSDEDLPLSAHCGTKANEIKCNQKTTVAVRQNQSQEADIYIFNMGLISFYRINFTEYNSLHRAHRSEKLVLLQYCCWIKREESIKKFIQTSVVAPFDASFMRKPHNCKPKRCMCCCVSKTPVPIMANDFKENQSIKPVTEINEPNYLIERAFKYKLEEADNMIKEQEKIFQKEDSRRYLKCAVIFIKYRAYGVIFEQTKLLGEYYVIGNNGMIESYVKPTTNRSYEDEIVFFKKCTSKHDIPTRYFQKLICCWYKREEVLACMGDQVKLSPNAFRFMRSAHLCKSHQCKCCCKSTLNSIRLENVTIQKRLSLYPSCRIIKMEDLTEEVRAKEQLNKLNRTKRELSLSKEKTRESYDVIDSNIPNKHITKNTNETAKPNATHKKKQNVTNNNIIDLTDELPSTKHKVQKKTKSTLTPNREFVDVSNLQDDSNQICLPIQGTGPNATDIPYTVAINNISLKDLKLSVNVNGKLTATINARPECLTTVELKVISDILAHASKQITQLGLTPEDFCKRVNSVRAANLNSLLSNQAQAVHVPNSPAAGIKHNNTNCDQPAVSIRGTVKTGGGSTIMQNSSMRKFKSYRLIEPIPKTNNRSIRSSIYQNMSVLGGDKGMHLMHAYWLHCKGNKTSGKLKKTYKPTKPDVVQVCSLPDYFNTISSKNKNTFPATNKAKRKIVDESTNTCKKIRVKPAAELINATPQCYPPLQGNVELPPSSNLKRSFLNPVPPLKPTGKQYIDKDFRNDTVPIQRLSDTIVTESQPMMVIEPLVSNNSLLPKQNGNKLVASAEHNRGPYFANLPRNTQAAFLNKNNETEVLERPYFANLPRNTQAAVLNKNNGTEVVEKSPLLHKMLLFESMPPLIPIRLEPRENPKKSKVYHRNQSRRLGTYISRHVNLKQYHGPKRKRSEINIDKTLSPKPVSEDLKQYNGPKRKQSEINIDKTLSPKPVSEDLKQYHEPKRKQSEINIDKTLSPKPVSEDTTTGKSLMDLVVFNDDDDYDNRDGIFGS